MNHRAVIGPRSMAIDQNKRRQGSHTANARLKISVCSVNLALSAVSISTSRQSDNTRAIANKVYQASCYTIAMIASSQLPQTSTPAR